jgi:stage III sporulation protein AE
MAMTLPGILESGVDLSKISAFLKKSYTTVLGVLTFLLSICLSAQSLLASRADSLAMRSGRYAIGQMIPVVGGALSGSLDTLAAGVGMLRGLAGGCGVILLFLTCLPVLLQMLALRTLFDLGATLAHLLGCAPESAMLGEASSLFGYMAAAVAMCTAVFIIAVGAFAASAAAWVA